MSWAKLRPLVYERLLQVEDIGAVHDYIRHTRFWDEFFKRHVRDQRVRTWEFSRTSQSSEFDGLGVECVFRDSPQVLVIGREGVHDASASEHGFQDLVDRVLAGFRSDTLFEGAVIVPVPPQLESLEHATYGGVLVHEARITLTLNERSTSGA